jgi:hypothetical protein
MGLRVYLGPAYRSGNQVVDASEAIGTYFDEARGLAGLEAAIEFCRTQEGLTGGCCVPCWRLTALSSELPSRASLSAEKPRAAGSAAGSSWHQPANIAAQTRAMLNATRAVQDPVRMVPMVPPSLVSRRDVH